MSGPRSIGDRLAEHRRQQAEDATAWGERRDSVPALKEMKELEEFIAGDLVGLLVVESAEYGFDAVRVVQLVGLRLLEREGSR